MRSYQKGNMVIRVREGSVLEQSLLDEEFTLVSQSAQPTKPDLAVPELSQISQFFKTDADKETLEKILAEYKAGEGGGA